MEEEVPLYRFAQCPKTWGKFRCEREEGHTGSHEAWCKDGKHYF